MLNCLEEKHEVERSEEASQKHSSTLLMFSLSAFLCFPSYSVNNNDIIVKDTSHRVAV